MTMTETVEEIVEEEPTPVDYSQEQIAAITDKVRELRMSGNPGIAFALRDRLRAGLPIEPHEYMEDLVHPEKSTHGVDVSQLEVPARNGVGSGRLAWQDFAKLTVDMEPAVIDNMNRRDIIVLLEEKGIIEVKDPLSGKSKSER